MLVRALSEPVYDDVLSSRASRKAGGAYMAAGKRRLPRSSALPQDIRPMLERVRASSVGRALDVSRKPLDGKIRNYL
jgi:hypothetical protein